MRLEDEFLSLRHFLPAYLCHVFYAREMSLSAAIDVNSSVSEAMISRRPELLGAAVEAPSFSFADAYADES